MEFFCSLVSVLFFLHASECARTEMVVNTVRNPNLALAQYAHALVLALRESRPHSTAIWGVWLMQTALMASGPWKNPSNGGLRRQKEGSVHFPGQNAAVSCKNYRRSFKCRGALGLLKKEEKENPIFDPCWLAALENFASMFCPFLVINRCHACLKLQH